MDIALAGLVCVILAVISKKLSLPSVPSYILAGLVLGSGGLGILRADEVSNAIAEAGVIMLLFYIGVNLNPKEISEKREMIFHSGLYDFLINFSVIYIISVLAGFSHVQAFLVASALYISSSAIVLQSLIENRKLIYRESEIVIWIMVFEDIVIAILIVLNNPESSDLFLFMVKVLVFTAITYMLSSYMPRLLGSLFQREDEIPALFAFTVALLGIAFEEFFHIPAGYSAIMLGLMLSGIKKLREIILPFKDVFLVLFFFFFGISVKLSTDGLILGIALAAVAAAGKITSGLITGRYLLKSWLSGLEIGLDTVARGEFSIFLIFAFGIGSEISAVTTAVIITSIAGAFMSKNSERIKSLAFRMAERVSRTR